MATDAAAGLNEAAGDPQPAEVAAYPVACSGCRAPFDALTAPWCDCLATERSLVCPKCGRCFCQAPLAYKQRFWASAPRQMWDAKWAEHHREFTLHTAPDPGDVQRPLVLVVDDEPDIRRLAEMQLKRMGFGVVMARNGAEGLEMARNYRPDLVLTDALMPKLDGRDLCRAIKDDPQTAGAKVVLMTSVYTSIKYRTQGGKNSYRADDYLSKPLDVSTLETTVRKHLR